MADSDFSDPYKNVQSAVHVVDVHGETPHLPGLVSTGSAADTLPTTSSSQQNTSAPAVMSTDIPAPIPCLPDSILEVLGDPKGKQEVFGPKIPEEISKRWGRILCEGLNKDQKKALTEKIQAPENFQLVKEPKLNPEIAAVMTESTRNRDKRLEKAQSQLGMGISALTVLTSSLIERDIDKIEVIKSLSEINQLLLDLHFENTLNRRKLITYTLDKKFLEIVQEVKRDSLLFGENLADKIKASKTAEKSGLQIKKTNAAEASTSKKPTYQQGNWRGPPRHAQRGNRQGGAKSRPAYRSTRRPAPVPDRYQPGPSKTQYRPPAKTQ